MKETLFFLYMFPLVRYLVSRKKGKFRERCY